MSTDQKFYSLSEELLTAIIEEVVRDGPQALGSLKALRRSSPRFAYLRLILKTLFEQLRLNAAPMHCRNATLADISRIAPFVKNVGFEAPVNTWDADDDTILVNCKDFPNQPPDATLTTKHILRGEAIKVTWTDTLRALPASLSVRFESMECSQCSSKGRYSREQFLHEETCSRIRALVGDALFAAGIGCLAVAKVQIRELTLKGCMTGRLDWVSVPGWNDLDFDKLSKFRSIPRIRHRWRGTGENFGDEAEVLGAQAANNISSVLTKAKTSVEVFESGGNPEYWLPRPSAIMVDLPNLRQLTLSGARIRVGAFNACLLKMSSLESLTLKNNQLEGRFSEWKTVFDAIRDHPQSQRGIRVIFEVLVPCGLLASLEYNTNTFEEYLEQPEVEDEEKDLNRSLSLYLSGKIEYNDCLRWWFDRGFEIEG